MITYIRNDRLIDGFMQKAEYDCGNVGNEALMIINDLIQLESSLFISYAQKQMDIEQLFNLMKQDSHMSINEHFCFRTSFQTFPFIYALL